MKIRLFLPILFLGALASSEVQDDEVIKVTGCRQGDITDIGIGLDDEVWLATQGAGLLKSTDGGVNFDEAYSSLSNQTLFNNNVYSILINGDTICLGGGSKNFVHSPGFHVSTDGGSTFVHKGFEGKNIKDMEQYNDKILITVRGMGVQAYENDTVTPFNTGIEQANVNELYYDPNVSGFLAAGTDQGLYLYNSNTQIWDATPFTQPVINIVKGSNSTVYVADPYNIYETIDFVNYNQLTELILSENYTFTTIVYSQPYIYAGILPSSYENNITVFRRLNTITFMWEDYSSGFPDNPGIPQVIKTDGKALYLGTSSGYFENKVPGDWYEPAEKLTAGQITKVSYNEYDNSIWLGGAWGEVKVAFDINKVFTSNASKLSYGQVNDFAFTPNGTFIVQYGGVYYQANIGDPWEKRMNGLNSNGYTSIAYNPFNNTLVLAAFNDLYRSTDGGNQWKSIQSGYFDQVEYIEGWDKFIVSDLNNLLSSDGTGQTFGIFAADVLSLDFAVKNNSTKTEIGVAEAGDFKVINAKGNFTSLGLNGLPSGNYIGKVTYHPILDTWMGSFEDKLYYFDKENTIWLEYDPYAEFKSFIADLEARDLSQLNKNFNSLDDGLLLVATLGGGLYANASAVGVDDNSHVILNEFKLAQNYPNPFNPTTRISWQLPIGGQQSLKVFDVLGKEVTTLVDEFKPAGKYEIEFDASSFPSGIYFYQLKTGDFIQTKKMILLK